MNPVELLAVVFSMAAVWWTAARNPWCWPVGLVSVLLYAGVFAHARLYSDALLQIIYAALQCYGWWNWRRAPAGADRAHRPVVHTPRGIELLLPLLAALAAALLLGGFMARYTDAALPWLDAALTALSLVAQFWMARLIRLHWLLWIGVDVVYVGLYWVRDLPLTAALYVGFIALALWGWRQWRPQAS